MSLNTSGFYAEIQSFEEKVLVKHCQIISWNECKSYST